MATLYGLGDVVIATGFTVLRESRLTQRRTDVVHDPVVGGLPYIVRKDAAGLTGNLELLCSSKATADLLYDGHAFGVVRLEDESYPLDFWYAPVGGVGLPVQSSRNRWRLSVLGVQEVAP